MLISSIKLSANLNYQNSASLQKPCQSVNFGTRPEFLELQRIYSNPRYSYFFRRSEDFSNVVKAFRQMYASVQKPKVLVVGVGRGEEPLTYLAVIKDIFKNDPLDKVVDMNCVDLQPKISGLVLKNNSFTESYSTVLFAKDSFICDAITGKFFVKPNIFNYLIKTFNNPQKSHWDTSIEEYSSKCQKETYDMISMNKVLMYLKDKETQVKTVDKLFDMLKPDGIIISDSEHDFMSWDLRNAKNIKKINPGIWQKQK